MPASPPGLTGGGRRAALVAVMTTREVADERDDTAITSAQNSTMKTATKNQPPQPQPPSYHIMPITYSRLVGKPHLQHASPEATRPCLPTVLPQGGVAGEGAVRAAADDRPTEV